MASQARSVGIKEDAAEDFTLQASLCLGMQQLLNNFVAEEVRPSVRACVLSFYVIYETGGKFAHTPLGGQG
eukprot:646696-Amphidinium_carterae.4